MDLGMPLASLTGRLDAAVLGVFARSHAEYTGRQVHRLAGTGSASSINTALRRLGSIGLLSTTVRPYATLYRLNRDHLLWPAAHAALTAVAELRQRIRTLAEGAAPAGTAIILFGSVNTGTADAESDVDLVAVYADATSNDDRENFTDLLSQSVGIWTGNVAQVIGITRHQLVDSIRGHDPFAVSWVGEGETLYGQLPEGLQ